MGGQRTSPWKRKATRALRLSVKHWENLRDRVEGEPEPGAGSCECCAQFGDDVYDPCVHCPVSLLTGKLGCMGTPFQDAESEHYHEGDMFCGSMAEEVDFLKETLRLVRLGEVKP